MYIRRKVFSLLQNEEGEQKLFSVKDINIENVEEKTFSLKEDAEEITINKED